ncbi:hypothetical protein E4T38_09369 [Aureobasidium subglaciale]|nr:hypothetical protein E4T38_09369 [Aureobasidium subglaciale]KAI5213961.1 hypothetical protein E4T40_09320 [Aureobasidium subglaciale]KAI5216352.1 hypothetical protein E4T41_09321 [Aureobasidium subglaciale]KAI5254182.1 hypothetical protein E4T46_09276 [Aureobasidium subglaciale]
MPGAQDSIDDPYIMSCDPSASLQDEPSARKRKKDHSDHIDSLPDTHIDPQLLETTNRFRRAEPDKTAYNGPQAIHVVMLRVTNETSERPMPQSAFFIHDTALSFARSVLLQWCDAHYDDYHWQGPETLARLCVSRYAAYHSQTGQQLAVADVIRVSIFDAKAAEIVPKENRDVGARTTPTQYAQDPHSANENYSFAAPMQTEMIAEEDEDTHRRKIKSVLDTTMSKTKAHTETTYTPWSETDSTP